ncbi:unnamed protein product, partial [Effrenium voratum]
LANLWHDPLHQEEYLKGNVFLPRANGEVESSDTERHRRNFIRLGRAVCRGCKGSMISTGQLQLVRLE